MKAQGSPSGEGRASSVMFSARERTPTTYGPGLVPGAREVPRGEDAAPGAQTQRSTLLWWGVNAKCLSCISQMPHVKVIAALDKNRFWRLPMRF